MDSIKETCPPATPDTQHSRCPPSELRSACWEQVLAVFPDICLEQLSGLAVTFNYDASDIINNLCDGMSNGTPYVKRAARASKRRREEDLEDETAQADEKAELEEERFPIRNLPQSDRKTAIKRL